MSRPTNHPMTLPAAFRHAIDGGTSSLVCFGRRWTAAQLAPMVDALATGFEKHGLAKGDRVLIQLQNTPAFVVAALAAWRIGAVVVPVSPMYSAREVGVIAADAEPSAWVLAPATWTSANAAAVALEHGIGLVVTTSAEDFGGDLPTVAAGDTGPTPDGTVDLRDLLAEHAGGQPQPVDLSPDDLAALTYTSGTTGKPKGTLTSHRNLLWVGGAYVEEIGAGGSDAVGLAIAPLVHITGLAMHIGSWLAHGSHLVLGYRFDPNDYLDLIEQHRVTWSTGAATAFIALIAAQRAQPRDLASLKSFGCGGAPIPARLIPEIQDVLGVTVRPGYGLTESTGAITTTTFGAAPRVDPDSGVVSVGPAMGDADIAVRDLAGEDVGAGEVGEICIRGGGVTSGYWRNSKATEEAIRNGWLHTGDTGYLDADGWLFIVDRIKNMIVASGYNVWPREVEDVIYGIPAVREAAVIGVPHEYRGETVKAFVSLLDGQTLDPDDLLAHCRAQLAAFKVPTEVEVLPEIPKNANGKILHRMLRDQNGHGDA